MAKIVLVFAYGQKEDSSLREQTITRCQQALKLYKEKIVEKICLTCAIANNGVSMAEQMADYLIKRGIPKSDCLMSCGGGYNTAGEIDACLSLLKSEDGIFSVSSWYHVPRIWFLFAVRGRFVKLRPCFGGVILSDLLLEPLKIANALIRPFSSSKLSK